MRLALFGGLRPLTRGALLRDGFAGASLAFLNIPQVLGNARIAGTPVGFRTGVGVQGAIAMLGEMCGVTVGSRRTLGQVFELAQNLPHTKLPTVGLSRRSSLISKPRTRPPPKIFQGGKP